MRVLIEGSQGMDISSLEELGKIIPNALDGKALNYGQGEGQVEIEGVIFGLYCGINNCYFLQYEEGMTDWNKFRQLFDAIIKQVKLEFGSHLEFRVKGNLENREPHEKFL